MEAYIIATAISFMAGAMSYMVGRYWILPIFRYHRIRQQIASDFNGYGRSDDVEIRRQMKERAEIHRRYSVDLSNIVYELPQWYKIAIRHRSEFPDKAVEDLMKLSNVSEPEHARKRVKRISESLKISA
jgi:hypothetical protein